MNLSTSSQPPQQRLRDTPPHSTTQASQSESSSVGKGKVTRGKRRKPRSKKTDIIHARWTQEEEKLLAETYVQISENPSIGVDQTNKTFLGKVVSEYNRQATFQRTKDMITGK
ncbi:hypothetical protein Tco_1067321 [Tanacetum coccineum]|uniref:Myb-like domain-containing protein n=1 Tax=Tanacetum coccineum TaxID=301880 RepID=A0ABQ5HDS6_9ASTR